MRICLIASSRYPVREPFHGGLEAHTSALASRLIDRGHAVSVFAAPGSDPTLNIDELPVRSFNSSPAARTDVGATSEEWMQEHHAYLGLMLDLMHHGHERFDVVHNNSLHHLPVAMAGALDLPMVTTLHTPPVAWLESAMSYAPPGALFAAVSEHTSRSWAHAITSAVILNGVDTDRWTRGPGGGRAIWSGRIVPEKAPHLAIIAARTAGVPIDLAGPVPDMDYFCTEVEPRLGPDVRYLGHLGTRRLIAAVGASAVAVVSPQWDEPYGLVAAEAMSCGTPVAAFARGGLPELVSPASGVLAVPDDTDSLADAIRAAMTLDRDLVRGHAVRHFGAERMVDAYERLYRRAQQGEVAA